jgi:hypothetical protein
MKGGIARVSDLAKNKWLILYWSAILCVWSLYGLQLLFSRLYDFKNPYPVTSFLVGTLLTGVIVGYRWAIERIADFEPDIEQLLSNGREWFAEEFNQIFRWANSTLLAVFFTLLALLIATRIEIASWFPRGGMRVLGVMPYVLIGTAFGACLWPGYRMSVFVYRLSLRIEQLNPFTSTSQGIFKIARTFVKFEAVGIGLILIFGLAFLESPYRLSNRAILYSGAITSLVWTFWFFFTQYQIHRAMVKYKQRKQDWFSEFYERKFSFLIKRPNHQDFDEFERLVVLKKEIESIPVWPFDTRVLLTSVGLVLTPIVGALVQRFIGR